MRRAIPALLAFLLAAVSASSGNRSVAEPLQLSSTKPNFVVITVDGLGYADLGYNGASDAATPNIDRLAREGVVFANGYAAHSRSSGARATTTGGRTPTR